MCFYVECGVPMKLTNRLYAVSDMIDKCNILADIGTDHAYIPIYCLENKICSGAIACDINKGPVKIAQKNIDKYGFSGKITTRLSNGFENIKKGEADTFVIAGMGGLLIIDILKAGYDKICDDTSLILQPMIAVYELRKYLCENGFEITDESLAEEENKIYNIIKCKKGKMSLTEDKLYTGFDFLKNKKDLFFKHLDKKIYTTEKIINGLKKSENTKDELTHYETVLSYYESAKECLKNEG